MTRQYIDNDKTALTNKRQGLEAQGEQDEMLDVKMESVHYL